MESSYLDSLNIDQRRAVEHGSDPARSDGGPLLIIAGAGSGKTNTLAHRVAHLIVRGTDPDRILLLTFSRRAASEMRRRAEMIIGRTLGAKAPSLAWAGTFHAVGARLLREHAQQIGLDPAFSILDREDAADLMNLVRNELGLSTKEARFPTKSTCLSIYSRVINTEQPLGDLLAEIFPWCRVWEDQLRSLFAAYVEAKQQQAVLDYDDLLLYWAQMMVIPEIASSIGDRFDHILVDEYQDTNPLQASVLLGLKPDGRGLTVVGDDAQSIYAFRAATVRNILDFPGQFQPPARIITLERNYRSTQPILEASNAIIALASERFTKNLWSDRPSNQKPLLVTVSDGGAQARYVAEHVLENREAGIKLKSQAVLFRAGHHSGQVEIELGRRNIPFVKFGGLKFLEATHIKDVLGVLRWATNPKDNVAGFRVLQLMPGIGPKIAGKLLAQMMSASSPTEVLEEFSPPAAAGALWPDFTLLLQRLRSTLAGWPTEFSAVCTWYEPLLEQNHEDAKIRLADLQQLQQIAAGYSSREQFLTDLTLDPPAAGSDEAGPPYLDEDYLILSTIHSAKGQEWQAVFVLNVVDGCMPSDLGIGSNAEIEEERRLLYVAATRAKDQLHLMVPYRFLTFNQSAEGDRHVTAMRTRFIPANTLGLFEQRFWPVQQASMDTTLRNSTTQVDLRTKIRNLWR